MLVACSSHTGGTAAASSNLLASANSKKGPSALGSLQQDRGSKSPEQRELAHPSPPALLGCGSQPTEPPPSLGWNFSPSPSSSIPLKSLPSCCSFTRDESPLPPTLQTHIVERIESARQIHISSSTSNSSTPTSATSSSSLRSRNSSLHSRGSSLHSRSNSGFSLMSSVSADSAGSDFDSPASMSVSATPSSESPPTEIRVCPLHTPPLLPLDGQLSEPEPQPLDSLVDEPLASPRDTNGVGWFHAFTPAVGTVVRQLDYSFVWTAKHPRISELLEMRTRADPDADLLLAKLKIGFNEDAVAIIAQRAQRHTAAVKEQRQEQQSSPLASSDSSAVDADCFRFMTKYSSVPSWVDWGQIARGQRVFQRYGPIGLLILLYSSLIGGFGAPLINKVLNSSNNLSRSCPAAYARLVQTSLAILACMGPTAQTLHPIWSDSSIPADARAPPVTSQLSHRGDGFMASLRTRFLHAQVRKMLLAREGGWDTSTYGVPINQEDSSVTLMSFSFNFIDTLKRLGITISAQEKTDYMALWKYIGFLSGADPVFLDRTMVSYDAALPFTESAWFHLVHPDRSSAHLVRFVLSSVEHCFPFAWSPEFHAAVARAMLTPAWSTAIGLPEVGCSAEIKVKAMFAYLWTISKLSYVNRWMGDAICYVNFAVPCALSSYRFGAYIAKRDASKRAVIESMAPLDPTVLAKSALPLHHPAVSDAATTAGSGCPFLAAQKSAQPPPPPPHHSQLDVLRRMCKHAGCEHGGCRQPQLLKQHSRVLIRLVGLGLAIMMLCIFFLRYRLTRSRLPSAETDSATQLS